MSSMYLGDGLYVSEERGMVKLATTEGGAETNVIFLEDYVFKAFLQFVINIGWLDPIAKRDNSGDYDILPPLT